MLRSLPICLAISSVLLLGAALPGTAAVLYNGALGTFPGSQGYLYFGTGGTQSAGTGGTILDTTASDLFQAGYSRADQLHDRSLGYTYRFDLQVLAENHDNPNAQNNTAVDSIADRAGVSLIVLGNDLTGIELGFWLDQIWAQNDGPVKADPLTAPGGTRFTHGEGAGFTTTSSTRYDLSIFGATYALYAGGNFAAPILTGSLRNYSNEGFPYSTPNFFFLGDDTTSARGSFQINRIELTDGAIPEPATPALLGAGLLGCILARGRRRNTGRSDEQL